MTARTFKNLENLFRLSSGFDINIINIDVLSDNNGPFDSISKTKEHKESNYHELKYKDPDGDTIRVEFISERPINEVGKKILENSINLIKHEIFRRENGSIEIDTYLEAIGDANNFYIALDSDGIIVNHGSNWKKTCDKELINNYFTDLFKIEKGEGDLNQIFTDFSRKTKILFFGSLNSNQQYKASIVLKDELFVLLAQPVINTIYKLANYGLVLNDFLPHEYIAEYVFLQNSSAKALDDSRKLVEKVKQRNKDIESLSSFPSENPNPILRFSTQGELLYHNTAAQESLNHFSKKTSKIFIDLIQEMIINDSQNAKGQLEIDEKKFIYVAILFSNGEYVNFYLFDITVFIEEIELLHSSITDQRDFYEKILNGIPNDIAVFDLNHKYIYVNPKGIQNEEIRKFIIGKDDFDYCRLKGISDEMAITRRSIFTKIIETGSGVEWVDHHIDKEGNDLFVLRKMEPLIDTKSNKVHMVIGYGVDITKRVVAENELIESNQENNLLRKFIEKTNDAIQVVDESGQLIYLNEKAIDRLGFSGLNYKEHFVWEFEPKFSNITNWREHFDELKLKGSVNMISQNINFELGDKIDVDLSLNWEEINDKGYVIAISRDITEKRSAERELEQKRKFQEILIETARRYINIKGAEIEDVIEESLAFIGEFTGVDRVYIFDYDHQSQTSSNTFEWCAPGIEPEIKNLQNIPFEYIPDWTNTHFAGKEMYISNVEELENGELRGILEPQGIKSLLAIPMFNQQDCIGFVGFDSVRDFKVFSSEERNLLSLFAEMLVNMFERSNYLREIENSKKLIAEQNENLEVIIDAEIKKNLELSSMLTNQDKLATIGEVAAGIAHDLNTPLASINVGIESLDYSFSRIFENFISHLHVSEISHIYEFSKTRTMDIFLSSSTSRKETSIFNDTLIEHYLRSENEAKILSRQFVQCQIKVEEEEVIQYFLNTSSPSASLDLLFSMLNLSNMIKSSQISVKRATEVVQNMRSFIKAPLKAAIGPVNLDKSLKTVLGIFNHEIRKKVSLNYEVDETLEILGFDIKLFQLWSNLVKNALEAMSEVPKGNLSIYSSSDDKTISINISNNGPMIPEEIQGKIFNKFFSTKLHKSGTGIGLSIVKTILEDHNADIKFTSTPVCTTFSVIFRKTKTNG